MFPDNWISIPITEIAECSMGKTILAKDLRSEGIAVFSAGVENEPWGYVDSSSVSFGENTLVISARGTIGAPKLPSKTPFVSTQTTIRATFPDRSLAQWACRYLSTIDWSLFQAGNAIPMLTIGMLSGISLPLAGANEQRRIVAKLDVLFEKSRSIREKLDRLPRLLANLQKSILNSAFRGDLTKEWRANNPNVEPASELLKRIRAERRAKWEADLIAKGKDPQKAKYVEPEPVDTEGLPELPEGWSWATIADLLVGETQNGLYLPSASYAPGVPMLRITDYQVEYSLDASSFKQVVTTQENIDAWMLEVGNVLVNRVNSPSHLGKALLVEARHVPALFESNMMRLRPPSIEIGSWIASWINSPAGKGYLMASAKWAVNQASVNQRDVLGLPIPLAPIQEVRLVQERLNSTMEIVGSLRNRTEALQERVTRCDNSLLASAFRGELVPQDPNDEPASVLLERIRAQRLAAGTKRGRGRKAAA